MTHAFPVTVYYEDTDMGGIVYHANYLRFIERARSAWVRELGVDQNAMREAGHVFVVVRIEADYKAPAKFDDQLTIVTEVESVAAVKLILKQRVMRGDQELFAARVVVVGMDTNTERAAKLPAEVRALR